MPLESDAQLEHVHRTPTRPPRGRGGQWTNREAEAVSAAMRGRWAGGNRSPGALSHVIADPGPWPPALTPVRALKLVALPISLFVFQNSAFALF